MLRVPQGRTEDGEDGIANELLRSGSLLSLSKFKALGLGLRSWLRVSGSEGSLGGVWSLEPLKSQSLQT